MTEGRNIQCNDGCMEAFVLNKFSKVQLADGVEKTYFTCQNCGKEYVVMYTDAAIRVLQSEQEGEGKRIGVLTNTGDADGVKRAQRRFDNRAKDIYQRMQVLRTSQN